MLGEDLISLTYVVIGQGPIDAQTLLFKRGSLPKRVAQLKVAIELKQEWDATVKYTLYKADLTSEEERGIDDGIPPVPNPSQKLRNVAAVSNVWPSGFPLDLIGLIVEVNSGALAMPQATIDNNSSSVGITDEREKAQWKIFRAVQKHNSSTLATPSKFRNLQENNNAILDGRPHTQVGLPIGLYHPVFDSFLARLDSTSAVVPLEKLADTLRLLEASQNMYDSELGVNGRTEALVNILDALLGGYVGVREERGTKSDGHISAPNGAFCLIVEVKNEIGLDGSDLSMEAAVSYSKYWDEPRMERVRYMCCCPSFILAVAGPWICILGAVILDRPMIQPLTPYLWIANSSSPCTQSSDYQLARVFTSLSSSISELLKFYASLIHGKMDLERFDPYIRHFIDNGTRTEFTYGKAIKAGKPVFVAQTKSQPEGPTKDSSEPRYIVVKFVECYHARAHRILAEAQLAPKVLFVSSEGGNGFKVAGRSMIVMERLLGKNISEMTTVPSCVREDISRALELLHSNNIVFGDLRPPNVIAVQDEQGNVTGGKLVDFDWCGEDGQAKYPTKINPKIDWPEGVGPGTTMEMIHDKIMFGKLF